MKPLKQTHPKLYSPDLDERYAATVEFIQAGGTALLDFWEECKGAANGWLMLIGPSPGSFNTQSEHLARESRARTRIKGDLSISGNSKPVWEIIYDERRKARSTNWRKLATAASMGQQNHAALLTSLCNLDHRNQALEKDIREEHLRAGRDVVCEAIELTRPRLVLPLTMKVHELMLDRLREKGWVVREETHGRRRLAWFRIPECHWESLFMLTPKHPSRVPSNLALSELAAFIKTSL